MTPAAQSPAEHLLASPGFAVLLVGRAIDGGAAPAAPRVVVHPHCQGRAAGLPAADRTILERLGFAPEILDAGCCGLAGSFGYSLEHEAILRRTGEEQWLPRVTTAVGHAGELVMDGYSCTMQLAHLADLAGLP